MQFEFSTTSRIIFGPGKINLVCDQVRQYGNRVLVVSAAPQVINEKLFNNLGLSEFTLDMIKVVSEPTVDFISTITPQARDISPDVIIGIGGGSAIDSAKALSVFLTNQGDITDYLEVIGKNKAITKPAIPVISVPTTAGTGSEVTRNAVIGSPSNKVKVSLRSQYLFPRIALVDPELTITLPPAITAITGLDALTQLIEPFTCNIPNPVTDALCIEGIQRISRSIYSAYDKGTDIDAREDMSLAALFSGIALTNAKLGAVHGFAGPIGGEINAHHGAICASLLANMMETNISALSSRAPEHPVLERYAVVGRLLTGRSSASAEDGIRWIRSFCSHANIQPLASLGLTESMFEDVIGRAQIASSMKGNPIALSMDELRQILEKSL